MPAAELLGLQIDLDTKLRSGAITSTQLARFLKGQNPFEFPKQITIGNFKSKHKSDLDYQISNVGGACVGWVRYILDSEEFVLSKQTMVIKLAVISPEDLGFSEGLVGVDKFFAKAILQGYRLCPAEVGPQLRMDYLYQPAKEELHLAMNPILATDGHRYVFSLMGEDIPAGVPSLGGSSIDLSKDGLPSSWKWVFQPPEKK